MKFKTLGAMALSACMSLNAGPSPAQIEQEVSNILEKNCSSCHDNQFLDRNVNLIPNAITNGVDGFGVMPLGKPELDQSDIDSIQDWVDSRSSDWHELSDNEILSLVKDDLEYGDGYDQEWKRYFTVTNNRKSDFIDLTKLLNRFSWRPTIIYPEIVHGSYGMIFSINVRTSFGPAGSTSWQLLEAHYQDDGSYQSNSIYDEILDMVDGVTQPKYPIIPIDWFLENASKPPLYHDILRLPNTEDELTNERLSPSIPYSPLGGIVFYTPNPFASQKLYDVVGIAEGKSNVSYHNRIVERIPFKYPLMKSEAANGVYYRSYDFDNSTGINNIAEHPLNFEHAGGEMIFTLPNGLHAYFITNSKGVRLPQAPTDIVAIPDNTPDDISDNSPIINGTSCMTCHNDGFIEIEEIIDEIIDDNGPYIAQETMNDFIKQDNIRYRQVINDIKYMGDQLFGQDRSSYGAAPQQPTFVTNAALGVNYPNPFNPETWIPYELDEPTNVTIEIYGVNGQLVRSLDLGHQPSGVYMSRSRAAYWDGKNEYGERVASGVYFYTLITKNFIATRKMVIRK